MTRHERENNNLAGLSCSGAGAEDNHAAAR